MPTEDEIEAKLRALIPDAISSVEGGVTTRWFLAVESVGPDGNRGIWFFKSDDTHDYEVLGMLERYRHEHIAANVRDVLND